MSGADTMLPGHSRPARSKAVAWQTIDGETVLLLPKEKELLGLNEVGRRVWEMADGETSIDQMVATVRSEYRVSIEVARADVLRFLRELMSLSALDLRHV